MEVNLAATINVIKQAFNCRKMSSPVDVLNMEFFLFIIKTKNKNKAGRNTENTTRLGIIH